MAMAADKVRRMTGEHVGAARQDLTGLELPELMAEARSVRDAALGTRVTYSPKVFIPLTMLCRDKCGYCTFAQPPARLDVAVPRRPTQVLAIARAGARPAATRRCSPSASAPRSATRSARAWLAEHGYASTVDYLAAMARLVLDEIGPAPPRQRRRPVPRRARRAAAGRAVARG